ncbi:hypothetical protein FB451DRAFT_362361 [Mycena latifolia]|nr:hypothetical protein FB451DRAFT_362361 [Mycena latifolia]
MQLVASPAALFGIAIRFGFPLLITRSISGLNRQIFPGPSPVVTSILSAAEFSAWIFCVSVPLHTLYAQYHEAIPQLIMTLSQFRVCPRR